MPIEINKKKEKKKKKKKKELNAHLASLSTFLSGWNRENPITFLVLLLFTIRLIISSFEEYNNKKKKKKKEKKEKTHLLQMPKTLLIRQWTGIVDLSLLVLITRMSIWTICSSGKSKVRYKKMFHFVSKVNENCRNHEPMTNDHVWLTWVLRICWIRRDKLEISWALNAV